MKLILHIGMSKCGSSALQSYLSSVAFQQAVGGGAVYVALHQGGVVFHGDDLIKRAAVSPHGYWTSHAGEIVADLSPANRVRVCSELRELGQRYGTVIMSNEGWGARPHLFGEEGLFADLAGNGFEIVVLAYVRPQVEWMNSAWWQWGAWTKAPLERWVNQNRPRAKWSNILQEWVIKPWVTQVDARLLDTNVVHTFMSYLGFSVEAGSRVNSSLPGVVLRLFQRNRELRPGPHDSAVDFALARQLRIEQGKSPWVIGPKRVEQLLEYYREDNQQLADLLPREQSEAMLADPRWWSMDPYLERELQPAQIKRLNPDELEQLVVAALEAVYRLDGELRQLRSLRDKNRDNPVSP